MHFLLLVSACRAKDSRARRNSPTIVRPLPDSDRSPPFRTVSLPTPEACVLISNTADEDVAAILHVTC